MERAKKLEILRKDPSKLSEYKELWNDFHAVFAAVDSDNPLSVTAYTYASPTLRKDTTILFAILSRHGNFLGMIEPRLRIKVLVLAAVKNQGFSLRYAPEELRADKEVVLAAVNKEGLALLHASEELRADKEVVLVALNQEGFALQFASRELRADKEVVLAAVNKDGLALLHATRELQADKEVVLAAVNQEGFALQFASRELQADKEVVLAAVNNRGDCIGFASEDLQRDKDVIRISMKRPYMEGQYKNINMPPEVGDYVTLDLHQPNPVVHKITEIIPPNKVQLNNTNSCLISALNFIPEQRVIRNDLGLRLRDPTFTIRGGKRKKHTKRFKRHRTKR